MTRGTISVDQQRCKGCLLCITVCPQKVLAQTHDNLNKMGHHPVMLNDPDGNCTGCAICAVICPDVCITVFRETAVNPHLRGKPSRKQEVVAT
jgi:2-oxoglutarate ferredoxin oxidoreductase subunit delta